MSDPLAYKDAGVNIDEGTRLIGKIKQIMKGRKNPGNLGGIGGFGGLYDLGVLNLKHPVLVTSIDGVGTKLNIARMMGKHDTVGVDLVNHSVNDILVQGAKPLYFTDYIGCGALDADVMEHVVRGMADACEQVGCVLIGGETAEMPGMYQEGDFDLVGAITGVVDKDKIITGQSIQEGDVLIGLPATGLHTNGYSLARKIVFEKMGFTVDQQVSELGTSIGEALLVPHRCYANTIYPLLEKFNVKGLAHITGGGITENLPRILPDGIGAHIDRTAMDVLPVFQMLQQWGNVARDEMYRVFNMGVGLIIVIPETEADSCLQACKATHAEANVIGAITATSSGVSYN